MTEKEFIDIFAENLISIMQETGTTQRELAKDSHLTEATISRYLSRDRMASSRALVNIAIALNCNLDDLSDVWIQPAGVYYILSDADLLVELLSGVCMVGIYYYSWICQATFAIHIVNLTQNLIMIIWQAVAC